MRNVVPVVKSGAGDHADGERDVASPILPTVWRRTFLMAKWRPILKQMVSAIDGHAAARRAAVAFAYRRLSTHAKMVGLSALVEAEWQIRPISSRRCSGGALDETCVRPRNFGVASEIS
jgi:hypothetical protein